MALSFFLLAPYLAAESAWGLVTGHPLAVSALGIAVTAASVVVMLALGIAKKYLGGRLGSRAMA